MGLAVFAAIVVGALLAGVAVQVLGARSSRYDVLIVGLTAAFGAYFASETFPGSTVFATITNFGPTIDGFFILPGVGFALLIATIAYLGSRDVFSPTSAAAA
jgi:hypothetical protein